MIAARTLYILPLASWIVVGGGCAGQRSQSAAELTKAAEERSQEAYSRASEAQAQAAAQEKRAQEAHEQVLAAKQRLSQAQAVEEQERLKAQHLKEQADRHLREASQVARQAEGAAARGQPSGVQTIAGQVAQATAAEVVLQTEGGRTMTFEVAPRTRILIGGEERSTEEIQQGADALVSYETSGGRLNAVTIQVSPAGGQE